ncbi:hypothetical protein [Nocardioides dongkuii]|uniref:hypothetical protein n=1 Tax=Nocardioides dongkuii TaxID=2760089 RepID=UPI0015FB1BA4|nr:hypothetical protein [Nocardioides dongkuii]
MTTFAADVPGPVPALPPAVDELGPAQVLARAEESVVARRLAIVTDLELVLRWADLHGDDPQERPGAVPAWAGGDHLVELGGDGTPPVQDLCLGELAIARGTHVLSTRSTMADVLDLRHRLPRLWLAVRSLEIEPWVAGKVASMSRTLDRHQVALVDDKVVAAVAEAPGRVLRIAEAAVIEADPDAHAARLEDGRRRRGVVVTPTDEHGLRTLIARLEAGDAVWLDATVDRVADHLRAHPGLRREHHPDLPEQPSKAELRAVALGWLARPHALAALLAQMDAADDNAAADLPEEPTGLRQRVDLHVHLSEAGLTGCGVARVEEIGPMLLDEVRRLLGHAHVELHPVIDLRESRSVNGYEHPTDVRDRVLARHPGDAFPHATTLTRTVDLDHVVPYRPPARGGPPGQTGDHNAAPLARRSHRTKTHRPYRVTAVAPAGYVWTTPHGLHRHVDPTGTHRLDAHDAWSLRHPGALDDALDRIEARLRR